MTGVLTSNESATVGLTILFLAYTTWMILDLAYWGKETACITSIYPTFSLAIFGLAVSNYDTDKGEISIMTAIEST